MADTKKTLVERLFAEQRDALRAFLYRSARCRLDASNHAQEAYLLMPRIADTDAILDLEADLFGVASNVAKEHAFQESRHGTPDLIFAE